jgi:CBS domain-containing protein
MKVNECMTTEVLLIGPAQTICEAAQLMADADTGALPVADNDRLVGVITDRDIAVRAVAEDLPPDTPVREVMSQEVLYCYDDEETDDVAKNMSENQIRRLPVVNRDKRLVGIISLGDLSQSVEPHTAGEVIAGISRPGGAHSQTTH